MDNVIVPQFKTGDFSSGITDGVQNLLKMAEVGVHGDADSLRDPKPKGSSVNNYFRAMKNDHFAGWPFRIVAIVLGSIGMVLGSQLESGFLKKTSLYCSGILIILGIFPPLLMLLLFMLPNIGGSGRRGGGDSYSGGWGGGGGGGGFSGGGFSGGSSGGGGASGSW